MSRAVVLTARDRVALGEAQRLLLSPLDYPTTGAWYRATSRELKQLLGADKAALFLPDVNGTGGPQFFTEEYPPQGMGEYPDRAMPFVASVRLWERMTALGAYAREELYRPVLAEFYRSAYYNEYLKSLRAYDAVGLTVLVDPRRRAAYETVAQLLLHHDRERGAKFGPRGRALLDVLLPAFRAGLDAVRRFGAGRADMGRLLDATGQALVVCDAAGRVVHQTPFLTALLAADPGGTPALWAGVMAVGRAVRQPARGAAARVVHGSGPSYRVAGTQVSGMLATGAAGGPAVLVTVERTGPPPLPSPDRLREQFGLTLAQARVALLLGQGRADKEVAATLGVSIHTARRHAEAVLTKLGLHRRSQVARVLLGGPSVP